MTILKDAIHDCINCDVFKKYGTPCFSSDIINSPACESCKLPYKCCQAPFLVLAPCEINTILDKIEPGEFQLSEGMIPFKKLGNIDLCKHFNEKTRTCNIHEIRPVNCRLAGCNKTEGFLV